MSRELYILAKEYTKTPATVLRKDLNLYQTSMSIAASSFLREIDSQSKKQKQAHVTLLAIIPEVDPKEK